MKSNRKKIKEIYKVLEESFGDLGWWPAASRFEVILGAVLTQNTAWTNVEKAIGRLKRNKLMSPEKIAAIGEEKLSGLIRSAGYHRVKAGRLKAVSRFIMAESGSSLSKLKKENTIELREKLLKVKGVGPETADSILVYALQKPVFVVDAYTRRIFSRHGLVQKNASYGDIQVMVHENFKEDHMFFNQFHALLVETGKRYCKKKKGLCGECPLKGM
ncbi:MAG: endonuclease III domain-containing protein [Candidatus Omnitrophota bacterium]|jgi:endonuclease-3 related protein